MKNLLYAIALLTINFSFAVQNVEIVGGSSSDIPKIAIVNFESDQQFKITPIIFNDFAITGEFQLTNYTQEQPIESDVTYVITGKIRTKEQNTLEVDYRLTNAVNKKLILSQTAEFSTKLLRKGGHAISNSLYQKITNTPGVFTSKIALAVKEAPHKYAIIVADYDGYNPKIAVSSSNPLQSLSWNSTGQYLSYVSYELRNKPTVWVQDIVNGSRMLAANYNGSNSSPVFTSDSSKLIVTLSKDGGSNLYSIANPYFTNSSSGNESSLNHSISEQSDAVRIIKFGSIDTEADISHDGQLIFTSNHDGGAQIFKLSSLENTPERLTQNLGNYNVSAKFSNDSSKISFIRRKNGKLQSYVMDLNTKATYPISTSTQHELSPSFAPNDKLILFSSGNKILYISNITGTKRTRINLKTKYDEIIDQRWAKNY